jgi:hypothetical protein
MDSLEDQVLQFVGEHPGGGLHDITIAKALDEDRTSVVEALRRLRDSGRIIAEDRTFTTSNGATELDNIRLSESS